MLTVRVYLCVKGGGGGVGLFFFSVVLEKKIITNSYFTFFLMFICQNVGNLKGFLVVYVDGLDLITLSSYGRGTSYLNNKKNQIKYLSIQLLIRGYLWRGHRALE